MQVQVILLFFLRFVFFYSIRFVSVLGVPMPIAFRVHQTEDSEKEKDL